jgi:hypothetical protein
MLWEGRTVNTGYGVLSVDSREVLAHRKVMADLHGAEAIRGKIVMHLCDEPRCVNPEHLRIGTQSENILDAVAKGRFVRTGRRRGTQCHFAKLTEDQVRAIRSDERSSRVVAEAYGIDPTNVWQIRTRRTWQHIP